jgi:hypothetical protein
MGKFQGHRLLLLAAVVALLGAGQLRADTLDSACTANTLAYYETNVTTQANGCSVGGLNFYGFNASTSGTTNSGPGSTPFTPSQIEITPVSNSNGSGFLIAPLTPNGFEATATGYEDVDVPFVVSCPDQSNCITDIYMSLTGSVTGTTAGGLTPGADKLTETYCAGKSPCSGPSATQEYLVIGLGNTSDSHEYTFPGVSNLYIDKDAQANGNNGTATVSSIEDLFSTTTTMQSTPEPSAILLLAAGLAVLTLVSRRRTKTASQS